jgi:hypothetical protein
VQKPHGPTRTGRGTGRDPRKYFPRKVNGTDRQRLMCSFQAFRNLSLPVHLSKLSILVLGLHVTVEYVNLSVRRCRKPVSIFSVLWLFVCFSQCISSEASHRLCMCWTESQYDREWSHQRDDSKQSPSRCPYSIPDGATVHASRFGKRILYIESIV